MRISGRTAMKFANIFCLLNLGQGMKYNFKRINLWKHKIANNKSVSALTEVEIVEKETFSDYLLSKGSLDNKCISSFL